MLIDGICRYKTHSSSTILVFTLLINIYIYIERDIYLYIVSTNDLFVYLEALAFKIDLNTY